MAGRTPPWGRDADCSCEPIRCLLFLGLDATSWDVIRVAPCLLWSCTAILSAVVFLETPIVNNRQPHLLPMLGAVQSAMPSFMCAALLMMYHRQRVRIQGLPRDTADALGAFYSVASTIGCFVYLALLMASVFVFQTDRRHEAAYFFLSSTWLVVTILWFIMQSCLKPSAKQLERLVLRHQALHRALPGEGTAVTVGIPTVSGSPVGIAIGTPVGVPAAPDASGQRRETELARNP